MGFFDRLFGGKGHGPNGGAGAEQEEFDPPSAQRVFARAMVLAVLDFRSELERWPRGPTDRDIHARLADWVKLLGLSSEMEKTERDFVKAPLGQADERVSVNSSWRVEGLAVLAWALKRFELPPYDTMVAPSDARAAVGLTNESFALGNVAEPEELLRTAELRPMDEIGRFASDITIVSWRLSQFRLPPAIEQDMRAQGVFEPGRSGIREPMDFAGYLRRHPSFKERWLEHLQLIDGDLAIDGVSVAAADQDKVACCTSSVVERQTAVYWLQGDHEVYSKVNPSTLLSAC